MSDDVPTTVRRLVEARTVGEQDETWDTLRPLGPAVVPYLAEAYATAGRGEARTALVYHCIPYARTSDIAFELGLTALTDRARPVRHRACGLLAYSLRREALPALRHATQHPDPDTATEAHAAIRAIEARNHHLYIDRDDTGRSFWIVNPEDDRNAASRQHRSRDARRYVRRFFGRGGGSVVKTV